MNENVKKTNNDTKVKKNFCKICGKKIFDYDSQITMCLKTKHGCVICLSCAYEIESAINMADLCDEEYMYEYEYEYEYGNEDLKPQPAQKNTVVDIKAKIKDNLPDKETVIRELKKNIVGQDHAIERITGMVYRNIRSNNRLLRTVPLLIGKSGQGKTEIVTELCKRINLPYVIENAKDFSETGYVGRNPSEIFEDLYIQCGRDISLTNHGVIVIDEFDKLYESSGNERDVSGSGVVNTLLSYLSGISVQIKDKYNNLTNYIDTSNIIFIFMGAFEDADKTISLYKIREKRLGTNSIGFDTKNTSNYKHNDDQFFIAEDIIKYGFSRQFVGRVTIIELNELTKDYYMHIFLHSEISIFKAYKEEFLSHGLTLICSKKLRESIVEKAFKKKTGVRGIKTVCEEVFLEALEYVESLKEHNYTRILFSNDAIEDPYSYKLR